MQQQKRFWFHYGWIVLTMGTLAVFGALGLARFGYSTVLPAIQADLALNNEQAGLLATSNLAGYLVMAIIGGALSVRYGARLVVTLGLFLAGIGMIFSGGAQNYFSLAVWRGLTGVGSGAANIAAMGLWAAWFAEQRRGLASGIAVSGSSLALIFTGLMVPWIITVYGPGTWRICWYIFGGITLLLAVGSFVLIYNQPSEKGIKPVGLEAETTLTSNISIKKHTWREVYRSENVWWLGLIYTAFGFSYIIYMTFFIKYLVTGNGYTGVAAGRLFMTMGWFSLLCGLLWGAVSDHIGRQKTLIILFLIHSVAFGLFAFGNAAIFFTISAILFGLTAWSIPAIMAAICGDLLGPEMAPAALGFITLFFGIGQALGPLFAGAIADVAGTFSPAFWLASMVAFLGAVGVMFLKRMTNHNSDNQD